MNPEFFTLAIRNLQKRKLRSFLTILGIFIAVATIFLLISLSLGLQSAVEEQFRLLGTDKFFIQPRGQIAGPGTGGAVELTEKDIDTIEKTIGVKETTYFVSTSAKVDNKNTVRFVFVAGLPLETVELYTESFSLKMDEGRFLEKGDSGEVVLGSQYKYNNFLKSEIRVNNKLAINDREFRIKGILQSVGNPQDDRIIYFSEDDFRDIFNCYKLFSSSVKETSSRNETNDHKSQKKK